MSNIHGLHSNRPGSDDDHDDDDDERRPEDRYVGGVDSRGGGSGLAVQPNPDHGGDSSSPRDSIFNLAGEATSSDQSAVRRTITMYRDGFTIDDGPYRRLDDPANAEFLTALARGVTPRELSVDEEGNRLSDVSVGLIDKRGQEYDGSSGGGGGGGGGQPAFQSFSGAGQSLGAASSSAADGGSMSGVFTPGSAPPAELDSSSPSTSIQIRLLSGKRLVIKINLKSPVSELSRHVDASGDGGVEPYVLVSGYPPRPLSDVNQTIEEAGLKGAQVMQKKA